MPLIAPSVLSADFGHLAEAVEMLNSSEADWIHCDVMDGKFVPNISFGFPVLEAIRKDASKPLDVHLMIVEPERYVEAFARAGAHVLSVHAEACLHLHRCLGQIRDLGMKAGVAINPSTPVESLRELLHLTDVVCMMSVNPGFGGQRFIERTYDKVRRLRQMIMQENAQTLIEIDGGVNAENAPLLVAAGADVLVAGNFVFGAKNPVEVIASLK